MAAAVLQLNWDLLTARPSSPFPAKLFFRDRECYAHGDGKIAACGGGL
jgi:hypothetical protein